MGRVISDCLFLQIFLGIWFSLLYRLNRYVQALESMAAML